MLLTLMMIHQDKAHESYDEHEDTLSLAQESQASDKIMEDVHKLINEADWALALATVQRQEALLIMRSLDADVSHCRTLIAG